MAVIEEALYDRLKTFAGLTALISTRVYDAQTVPQNPTLPLATYQRISGQRISGFGADTGLAAARFQLTGWDDDYGDAKAVKEQLRAALQRWRETRLGVEILDTYIENDLDLPFEPDTLARGAAIDALVWHREA